MAKTTPVITYKEIICKAIAHFEFEIKEMEQKCAGKTQDPIVKQILDSFIAERKPKLEALKEMYRLETGTEY